MSYSIRPATIADIPHIVRHQEQMFREMNIQALFEEMAVGMESCLQHAIPSRTYRGWMAVTDGGDVVGVSARHAVDAEVQLYDRLFSVEDPDGAASKQDVDFTTFMNPQSLDVLRGCKAEPLLAAAAAGARYQFERQGYFAVDPDSQPDAPVFNRTVSLKDSWAKAAAGSSGSSEALICCSSVRSGFRTITTLL